MYTFIYTSWTVQLHVCPSYAGHSCRLRGVAVAGISVLGCRTPLGVRLEVKHLEEKLEKHQEKEETIGKIKKHDDI